MSENFTAKRVRVGKKIGGVIYLHRSAINHLDEQNSKLVASLLPTVQEKGFDFEIIKVNPKESSVSFVHSPNWNEAHEPWVGDSLKVFCEGKLPSLRQEVKFIIING